MKKFLFLICLVIISLELCVAQTQWVLQEPLHRIGKNANDYDDRNGKCVGNFDNAQNLTVQVSPDSSMNNRDPSIEISDDGKVWVMYVSDNSKLMAGYWAENSWHSVVSNTPPGGISSYSSSKVQATIDEAQRVWFVYTDTVYNIHVGFYENGLWNKVDSPPYNSVYGIIRNHGQGVWYFPFYGYQIGLQAWYAVGKVVVRSVPVPWNAEHSIVGAVSISTDSLIYCYGIDYSYCGMTRCFWLDSSVARFSETGRAVCIEGTSGDGVGRRNVPLSIGTDGVRLLAMTKVWSSWDFQHPDYNVYLLDTSIRASWPGFIADIDNSGDADISGNGNYLAIAWLSHKILTVRFMLFGRWLVPVTLNDALNDSLAHNLKVAVSNDYRAWVTYTANRNNSQHVFLSRVGPTYTVDQQFSTLPSAPLNVRLQAPSNSSFVAKESVKFSWQKGRPEVLWYRFELSEDSTFLVHGIDTLLRDTSTTIHQFEEDKRYWWRVTAFNVAGWSASGETRTIHTVPSEFRLTQNYPNPFNSTTRIRFSIPRPAFVTLTIYNLLGEQVAELVRQDLSPQTYDVYWIASGFASGVYYYRIRADGFVQTKKLLLVK